MSPHAAQLVSLSNLYIGYYNRAPDAVGLNYWAGRLDAGMSLKDIAQSFSVQTESTSLYPYLQNPYSASVSTFLTSVYANLFNRAPDAAGLAYWSSQISAGTSSLGSAIINIISGAQGSDIATLSNKAAAGLNWANVMSNVPGATFGSNEMSSARALIAGVTSDPATVTAAATATTNFFNNGGGIVPTAVVLTSGVDSISNANVSISGTFNGVSNNGTGPTFGSGDIIAPIGGTRNSIVLSDMTATGTAPFNVTGISAVNVSNIQTATISSSEALTVNTASTASGNQGWSGLTTLNVNDSGTNAASPTAAAGNTSVTAAATTNINLSVTGQQAQTTTIAGGANVNATVTGITGAGAISIGGSSTSNTAPTGTVTVSTNMSPVNATVTTAGAITIRGGTSDVVTQTIQAPANISTGQAQTQIEVAGATTINGTAITKSVAVTQSTGILPTASITWGSLTANQTAIVNTPTGVITVTAGAGALTDVQVAQIASGSLLYNNAGTALLGSVTNTGGGVVSSPSSNSSANTTISVAPTINAGTVALAALTFGGTGNNPAINTSAAVTGGIADGSITITDSASSSTNTAVGSSTSTGNITSVSVTGMTGGTVTINDNALANAGSAGLTISNVTNLGQAGTNPFGPTVVTINNGLATQAAGAGTLNLNLSGVSSALVLQDTNAELTGLNINVTGNNYLSLGTTSGNFTNVTSLTVGSSAASAGTLTLNGGLYGRNAGGASAPLIATSLLTKLGSLSVTGTAGLNADVSTQTGITNNLATITDTGSGTTLLAISPSTQSFNGSGGTGSDYLSVSQVAARAETAGTGAVEAIIWTGSTLPTTLLATGGSYSGFNTFGIGGNAAAGTYNMANLTPTGNTINNLLVTTALTANTYGFSNVTPGTSLSIDSAVNTGATINYSTTGTTGAANTLNLTLGQSSSDARVAAGALAANAGSTLIAAMTLADASSVPTVSNGLGTLNVTANASLWNQGDGILQLNDISLNTINISGNAAFDIYTLANDRTTSLTINNNSTSLTNPGTQASNPSGIGAMTDNSLAALTLTGTGAIANGWNGGFTSQATTFTITNNDTYSLNGVAQATIMTAFTDNSMVGLNVAGSAPITFSTLNDSSATLSINNTDTNVVAATIANQNGGFYNDALALTAAGSMTLSLSGTGRDFLAAPTVSGTSFSILDSDSGAVVIGNSTISTATSLGLGGAITINTNGAGNSAALIAALATSETFINSGSGTLTINESQAAGGGAVAHSITLVNGITYNYASAAATAQTISGVSDNANNTINLATGATHSITLGNGNNVIRSANTLGDTIILGSGNNNVAETLVGTVVKSITATSGNNIINFLGADTAGETVTLGAGNNIVNFNAGHNTVAASLIFSAANAGNTSSFTLVNNAVGGIGGGLNTDTITFANLAINNTVASAGAASSIAAGVATAQASGGLTGIVTFTNGGTTYVYENTGNVSTSELVGIVGTHTFNAATVAGTTVLTVIS